MIILMGSIGFESLRSIGAIIDTVSNTITVKSAKVQLKTKIPNKEQLNFHENETLVKQFPVRLQEGDFLIEHDIIIGQDVVISTGVYSARNGVAIFPLINLGDKPVTVCIDKEGLFMELHNFEGSPLMENEIKQSGIETEY